MPVRSFTFSEPALGVPSQPAANSRSPHRAPAAVRAAKPRSTTRAPANRRHQARRPARVSSATFARDAACRALARFSLSRPSRIRWRASPSLRAAGRRAGRRDGSGKNHAGDYRNPAPAPLRGDPLRAPGLPQAARVELEARVRSVGAGNPRGDHRGRSTAPPLAVATGRRSGKDRQLRADAPRSRAVRGRARRPRAG